ncbi:MAG: FAD-dependent oxidoreductase [Oscillospiraceae bacterium]|jgi:NAD(P)H-nitrite reductase large subunit|nr:FAD-dependent oxidoreductase [Oscillospiraceae bacterium]
MKLVIIGNSAAAVGCIEGLREIDKDWEIVVISDEPYHTYSRPLISYLLFGKTDEQRMKFRADDFYECNNVTVMLGVTVTAINANAKIIKWSKDGSEYELAYDKLLNATGSTPFVPPMTGLDSVTKKTTFMSLDDAKFLQENVTSNTRVFIIGAGLIGLKCAEGVSKLTKHITVCDLAPQILPSILNEDAASLMQRWIESNDVEFYLGDTADKFEGNKAVMKSGKVIDFDVLVLAVGVRPNVALVKDAGGEVNRGIVTDSYCRTSLSDVYAAGDCSESYNICTEQNQVLALLPNAYAQGACVGRHIAGLDDKPYDDAIPMNAIGFWGKHILSAGAYTGERYEVNDGENYRLICKDNGRLMGFILIGEINRAGIYTTMIREKTPLDSVNFDIIKDKPGLIAFSGSDRKKKLAGVER